jgi:hypothetical protein
MPWPESGESDVGKWIAARECAIEYSAKRGGAFRLNESLLQAVSARFRGQSLELRVSHSVVTPWLITFFAMLLVVSGAFVFGPNNVSSITFFLAIPTLFICFGLTLRHRGCARQAGVELLERLEQHFTSLDEQRTGASSPPKVRVDVEGPNESEHVGDEVGAKPLRAELAPEV